MKNSLDIAFYGFSGDKGGIGHVMINLMSGLADLGVKVNLLLHGTNNPDLDWLTPNVKIVQLGEGKKLLQVKSLASYLKSENPDIILCNRERANRVALFARRRSQSSVKFVIRVGNPLSSTLRKRHLLQRLVRKFFIKLSYKEANLIIANSKALVDDIANVTKISIHNIAVLLNPTVTPKIFTLAKKPIRHPWLCAQDIPVILACGRLTRQKDFPTLIRAFAELRKTLNCRLIILGKGNARQQLSRLATDLGIIEDIEFPGFVDNPFVYMKKCSVFVLSSVWEGSPNVLIQALALGAPVVATDCLAGPREILADGKFGKLVNIGDVEGMTNAISLTLRNPLPQRTGQQAAEPFRADRCVEAYYTTLKKLI